MHVKDQTTGSYDTVDILKSSGIDDVQVNGTSVVSQGVANVPVATNDTVGVVQANSNRGVGVSANRLYIYKALGEDSKTGTNEYRPIVPYNQHIATFYGLAKAASDTTQSASTNPVGIYTDEAKVAIQKMLGIYEAPWELIREDTFTNATSAAHTVSVDGNGQAFELTDAVMLFELPKQNVESKIVGYIKFNDGSTLQAMSIYFNTTQAANANGNGAYAIVRNEQGLIFATSKIFSTHTNSGNLAMAYRMDFPTGNSGINFNPDFKINNVVIDSVTGTGHYKLYGKRKWS